MAGRYGYDIGEFSYGRPKVRFPESGKKLTIGRYCSIADKVEILLGGNHRTDWGTTFPFSAFRELWPQAPRRRITTPPGATWSSAMTCGSAPAR